MRVNLIIVGMKKMKLFMLGIVVAVLVLLIWWGLQQKSSEQKREKTRMEPGVAAEQTIHVGKETVVESPSPSTQFAVVFEDDGETGYFYGLDTKRQDNPIVDALHIYNVANVTDKDIPSKIQIVWSADGLKSALIINRYPHAVFDFEAKRAYCRTGFPPPSKTWTKHSHDWDDRAMDLFK